MKIERKKISSDELLLYFCQPLPIIGTYYNTGHPLLQNINLAAASAALLLTTDFIYLKSTSPDTLSDLEMLVLAETEDFLHTAPQIQTAPIDHTEEKIRIILKTAVAPLLQRDGGDIELISCTDGIVHIRFLGKCNGCPCAEKTLKNHVEKNLIRYLPEIKEVRPI